MLLRKPREGIRAAAKENGGWSASVSSVTYSQNGMSLNPSFSMGYSGSNFMKTGPFLASADDSPRGYMLWPPIIVRAPYRLQSSAYSWMANSRAGLASSQGDGGNDGITTGLMDYGLYRFDEAGLSLQYLNKSNKLSIYKDWNYGNQYTTNTKIATRGNALLFGINQFSTTRSYLTGETSFGQFKTGTGINVLGSLSPQYGVMFMTNSALKITQDSWSQYNSKPNALRQFYNNMMSSFEEWRRSMNGGF